MKKLFSSTLIFFLLVAWAYGQSSEELTNAYIRAFDRGGLDAKIGLIVDVGSRGLDGMGPLYEYALEFVLENRARLNSESRYRLLAAAALKQIAAIGYAKNNELLLDLFEVDEHSFMRVPALATLGVTGKGDEAVVRELNKFLDSTNTRVESGLETDMPVVMACIQALGKLGEPSSFPILFNTMKLDSYLRAIQAQAMSALFLIEGGLKENLNRIIDKGLHSEKLEALDFTLETDKLGDGQKTEIAEFALAVALKSKVPRTSNLNVLEIGSNRELRFLAARALSRRRWAIMPSLAVENFDVTLREYEQGVTAKAHFLEAIDFMGNTGTPEAADRLVEYLQYVNKIFESGHAIDEQIVLSLLAALVDVGAKKSIDHLLTVQYLDYSNTVKAAADNAVKKLFE